MGMNSWVFNLPNNFFKMIHCLVCNIKVLKASRHVDTYDHKRRLNLSDACECKLSRLQNRNRVKKDNSRYRSILNDGICPFCLRRISSVNSIPHSKSAKVPKKLGNGVCKCTLLKSGYRVKNNLGIRKNIISQNFCPFCLNKISNIDKLPAFNDIMITEYIRQKHYDLGYLFDHITDDFQFKFIGDNYYMIVRQFYPGNYKYINKKPLNTFKKYSPNPSAITVEGGDFNIIMCDSMNNIVQDTIPDGHTIIFMSDINFRVN